jgi:MATE family multidrug resistance protein
LFRLSLVTGVGFAALFLVGLFFDPELLLGVLTSHRDLIVLARFYAPWLIPVLIFGALAFMYDGLFLGLTEGRRLRNAMLVSTFVVFVPLAAAAYYRESNGLLWLAMALFMVARTVTLGIASRGLLGPTERVPS